MERLQPLKSDGSVVRVQHESGLLALKRYGAPRSAKLPRPLRAFRRAFRMESRLVPCARARTAVVLDDGSGGGPAPRYYNQAAWSDQDGALYIYGGLTNTDPLNFDRSDELWKWTDAGGWSQIATSGTAPSPRAFYGSTIDQSRNRLILFAGQVPSTPH